MILSASPTTLQSDMSKSFAFSSRFNYNNIRLIQLLSMNLIRHEINKRNARIKGVQNTAVTLNDFNIGICSDLACRQNAGANRCNLWSVIGNQYLANNLTIKCRYHADEICTIIYGDINTVRRNAGFYLGGNGGRKF